MTRSFSKALFTLARPNGELATSESRIRQVQQQARVICYLQMCSVVRDINFTAARVRRDPSVLQTIFLSFALETFRFSRFAPNALRTFCLVRTSSCDW